jgi:indole-3-glycerol phosphate synthase
MAIRNVLKEIVQKKKERLQSTMQQVPLEQLQERIAHMQATLPFEQALRKPRAISLIAELKKASPSRGIIRAEYNPVSIAQSFAESGAQALSVLTEEDYFMGSLADLEQVRKVVQIPMLRKDFIIDTYQIYEARAFGADALLLIADVLSKDTLSELMQCATGLGMGCLVETHNEKDIKKALQVKASMIGINNRDLATLEVDLHTTERLFPLIPKDKTVVIESGMKKSTDVSFVKILGASAVLIGEAFMETPDICSKVEEIMGW